MSVAHPMRGDCGQQHALAMKQQSRTRLVSRLLKPGWQHGPDAPHMFNMPPVHAYGTRMLKTFQPLAYLHQTPSPLRQSCPHCWHQHLQAGMPANSHIGRAGTYIDGETYLSEGPSPGTVVLTTGTHSF